MSTFLGQHPVPSFDCGLGQIIQWNNLPRWLSCKYQRVWVDVGKLEANFQLDTYRYVGRFGLGGIDGKYDGVEQFLASGKARLEMSTVELDTKDARRFACIYDGRHRFA